MNSPILRFRNIFISTPNSDFNETFGPDFHDPNLSEHPGFRHWDHKFEWTRQEFQTWCQNLAASTEIQYDFEFIDCLGHNEYSLKNNLGPCSQAVVFTKKITSPLQEVPDIKTAKITNLFSFEKIANYKFICESADIQLLNDLDRYMFHIKNDLFSSEFDQVLRVNLKNFESSLECYFLGEILDENCTDKSLSDYHVEEITESSKNQTGSKSGLAGRIFYRYHDLDSPKSKIKRTTHLKLQPDINIIGLDISNKYNSRLRMHHTDPICPALLPYWNAYVKIQQGENIEHFEDLSEEILSHGKPDLSHGRQKPNLATPQKSTCPENSKISNSVSNSSQIEIPSNLAYENHQEYKNLPIKKSSSSNLKNLQLKSSPTIEFLNRSFQNTPTKSHSKSSIRSKASHTSINSRASDGFPHKSESSLNEINPSRSFDSFFGSGNHLETSGSVTASAMLSGENFGCKNSPNYGQKNLHFTHKPNHILTNFYNPILENSSFFDDPQLENQSVEEILDKNENKQLQFRALAEKVVGEMDNTVDFLDYKNLITRLNLDSSVVKILACNLPYLDKFIGINQVFVPNFLIKNYNLSRCQGRVNFFGCPRK